MQDKEFYADVTVIWSGNNHEAKNKESYIKILKESFKDQYDLEIADHEITNIREL